jgi:type VI secretion system secreted protein VgrG
MSQDPILVVGEQQVWVTELEGTERVGEPSRFVLHVTTAEPLDVRAVVSGPAALLLSGSFDGRVVHGVIHALTEKATRQESAARRYRVDLRSEVHALSLRRRSRVFQHVTVPALVERVLSDAGLGGDRFAKRLFADHPEREYVTQYDETDLAFVRRLCEEAGLFYRFESRQGFDAFVLEDSSHEALDAGPDPLPLVDPSGLSPDRPSLFEPRAARVRRPGKVTLRDYAPHNPSLDLEAVAIGGMPKEQEVEVYQAPFGYRDPSEGKRLAGLFLESLRVDARVVTFRSTFEALAPGLAFRVEVDPGYAGSARPEGDHVVVATRRAWQKGGARTLEVEAIPREVPLRLPRLTPRPRIAGVHSALVTGSSGDEIHTDAGGHVKVRFHWDREQPFDDTSSLPVRVLQSNLPGPMLVPRVGWEVMVAFEDGDPDRPYVLGRVYDGKWLPPFSLPANKTITSLGTISSPGGKASNSFHIDDATGREHMCWVAGFAKTTDVANHAFWQVAGFERVAVTGNQNRTVGGDETVSVGNAFVEEVGSQNLTVSATHDVLVKAAESVKVGTEALAVGGLLVEQVGNPVDGLKALAEAAVLEGVKQIPAAGEWLATGWTAGKAMVKAYREGGMSGLAEAAGQQAVGVLAGKIPGGDAISAAADGAGLTPWSDKAKAAKGSQEAGGGNAGASGTAAAAPEPAPGNRKIVIDGAMVESIGAVCSSATPGSIKWTGLGAVALAVGASHSTKAVAVSQTVGGLSTQTSATVDIKASGDLGHTVSSLATKVGTGLSEQAGGAHHVRTKGNLDIKVSGPITLEGSTVVFEVGSSVLAVHGGGVLIKAKNIQVTKPSKQSGGGTKK